MENLMGDLYGGQPTQSHKQPQQQTKPKFAPQPAQQVVEQTATNVKRGPHQSMTDMMNIVEDMYNGGGDSSALPQNSSQSEGAPSNDSARRTRNGTNSSAPDSNCCEKVKSSFKAWLQEFDQAVKALDSDKAAGDAMWNDVVNCVDECWKRYTEQGQL